MGCSAIWNAFPLPTCNVEKEINDLFEYLLLRAGRLILHPRNESRAIVLENVFFINKKEQQITKMLSHSNAGTHGQRLTLVVFPGSWGIC